MSYKQAILSRKSRRSFINSLPDIEQVMVLKKLVEEINEKENLNIQLMIDEYDGFIGFKAHYGMFSGVRNYIALVGPKSDENIHEKLGYYGEKILLNCEMLGLGTCWVGGTFEKEKCTCQVSEDEVFVCAIVFGNVKAKTSPKEKLMAKVIHSAKKSKTIAQMFYSEDGDIPNWFIEGMRMVQRAPSAMNAQPVKFFYSDESVNAIVKEPTTMQLYDLGIAKFHFEIGADGGSWEFGNGKLFTKNMDWD